MTRFNEFLTEAKESVYDKPAQEILLYFKEKGYDREKQIDRLKVKQRTFSEAKKALEILLGNSSTSKIDEPKQTEKKEKSTGSFDIENFDIKKKKVEETRDSKKIELSISGIIIGEIKERRDYVKRRATDRIRSKLATIRDLTWNTNNIEKILNRKISYQDFRDMYGYISPLDTNFIKENFYSRAKYVLNKGE